MTATAVRERLTRVTPLAMRFWDMTAASFVGDGLRVSAYLPTLAERRVVAVPNRTGVYVFGQLPGLRAVTFGAGDADFWASPPAQRSYTVEVVDSLRRFQPCRFDVTAPVRNLFGWQCATATATPTFPPQSVPLFASAGRTPPATAAVVSADLYDPAEQRPAAWAVMEVTATGLAPAYGLADGAGRVRVSMPYPEPPTNGAAKPLTAQTWPLAVKVFYTPGGQPAEPPDLCQVFSQPQASLWNKRTPAQALAMPLTLQYGVELAVKSETQSVLFVTAAGVQPG